MQSWKKKKIQKKEEACKAGFDLNGGLLAPGPVKIVTDH